MVATGAAMLALVGGWTLAVSTTTVGPSQNSNITVTAPNGFTTATVASTQVLVVTPAVAAYTNAGTQSVATAALSGSTLALAVCASGPCYENHLSVNGYPVTSGDYALQVVLAVTQPATGGTDTGFDLQVEVSINSNTLVFGDGYFATAVSSASSAQVVNVLVFVDLGTTTSPTLSSVSIQFNSCLTDVSCP